jgi:hypothetical protein
MADTETGILDVCFLTWVSITSGEKEKNKEKKEDGKSSP